LRFALLAAVTLSIALVGRPATAQPADSLLFCNQPEKLRSPGAYADAKLTAGKTYRIFYHYRNVSGATGPFVIAFQGSPGKPLTLLLHKGIAEPDIDPPLAGRQAVSRFLTAAPQTYRGRGYARFGYTVPSRGVASGIVTVRADQDVRFRLYFRNGRRVLPAARVVAVNTPHREQAVALSAGTTAHYVRIGMPEAAANLFDGAYGLIYSFHVSAPAGRRVRIAFSPRGGKAGLVGTVDGRIRQSRIVESGWTVFSESIVGPKGLVLTTLPFGGVFYPVELAFRLL